jgi:hypothetical protein
VARAVFLVMDRDQEVAMATARTAARPQARDDAQYAPPRRGWMLAALLGAMFLGSVDIAVANIAARRSARGCTPAVVSWNWWCPVTRWPTRRCW